MRVFKERYGAERTVFIFATDDPEWAERYFGDDPNVFLTAEHCRQCEDRVAFDFAALSSCNHSILRYSYKELWIGS